MEPTLDHISTIASAQQQPALVQCHSAFILLPSKHYQRQAGCLLVCVVWYQQTPHYRLDHCSDNKKLLPCGKQG